MTLARFLSKLSIRQQILLGMVPVLIFLGLLAITSSVKFKTFFVDFSELSTNTQDNFLFTEIERDINELERSILSYSYIGYAGVLKKITFLEDKIDKKFTLIENISVQSPDIHNRTNRLIEHYRNYKRSFRTAVSMQQNLTRIRRDILPPLNTDIINALDKFDDDINVSNTALHLQISKIRNLWLKTYLHIKDFERDSDPTDVRAVKSLTSRIKADLSALNINDDDRRVDILLTHLEQFDAVSKALVNVNRSYIHLINVVLSGKASEIDILIKEINNLIKAETFELETKIISAHKTAHINYLIFSIITGLIGVLTVLIVASRIAQPVNDMARTLSSLTTGDLDVDIPGQERGDEIGQMANAAHKFKNTAIELDLQKHIAQEALTFQNLISSNIPDLIFVKDSKFRIVQANPAFMSVYPEDQRDKVIGYTSVEDYDEEEAKEFLKFDQQALDEGYSETEETICFPDGITRTLFTKKVRFENIKGEAFILGVGRDITRSKKAEKEILRSNEELERFAYIASHDLQEPLRMVSNFTGLLDAEYGEDMGPDARLYMNFSIDAAKRMQELINNLLEYSKVGDNEDDSLALFDTGERVQYALANLGAFIDDTNAKIVIGDMPKIYAHSMRFSRLMQNLVGNALKYRHEDRIPEIQINAEKRGKEWVFSVSDNGIGIKDGYLQQVFVIFKRLHNKDDYGGTGLGLAICKKIVDSLDGEIWAESEYGKSSTFYFTIPIIEA